MRDLAFDLKELHKTRGQGSFVTKRDRRYMLAKAAQQLAEGGWGLQVRGLKRKHVDYLVERWRQDGLAPSTMRNRLSALRWWAREIGRPGVVPSNAKLELGKPAAYRDRTRTLDAEKLAAVKDPYVRMALRLQAEFGLRREEAIKFRPSYAVRGDRVEVALKGSWAKGGRPRKIPILTESQRRVLDDARQLAGRGGMIAAGRSYKNQREAYCDECKAVGFNKMHGLRHAYAQRRFETLTGGPCPIQGGPSRAELSGDRLKADTAARMTISAELGHGRMDVVATYIGK